MQSGACALDQIRCSQLFTKGFLILSLPARVFCFLVVVVFVTVLRVMHFFTNSVCVKDGCSFTCFLIQME